jgi:hypothetical protein
VEHGGGGDRDRVLELRAAVAALVDDLAVAHDRTPRRECPSGPRSRTGRRCWRRDGRCVRAGSPGAAARDAASSGGRGSSARPRAVQSKCAAGPRAVISRAASARPSSISIQARLSMRPRARRHVADPASGCRTWRAWLAAPAAILARSSMTPGARLEPGTEHLPRMSQAATRRGRELRSRLILAGVAGGVEVVAAAVLGEPHPESRTGAPLLRKVAKLRYWASCRGRSSVSRIVRQRHRRARAAGGRARTMEPGGAMGEEIRARASTSGGTNIKAVAIDGAARELDREASADAVRPRAAGGDGCARSCGGFDGARGPGGSACRRPGSRARDGRSIVWMQGRMEAVQRLDWTRASSLSPRPVWVLNDAHAGDRRRGWWARRAASPRRTADARHRRRRRRVVGRRPAALGRDRTRGHIGTWP